MHYTQCSIDIFIESEYKKGDPPYAHRSLLVPPAVGDIILMGEGENRKAYEVKIRVFNTGNEYGKFQPIDIYVDECT